MTCANCTATVERNLKKLEGVSGAVVNLSSERALVDYDPAKLGLPDMIARVQRAGYGVATGEADLIIKRLADDNDARRLEKALNKLEGVLEAQVSQASEKARVRYVPTVISQAEVRQAVKRAGFEAVELGGEAGDAEALARQHEIDEQRRLLVIGLIFTVPLFLFAMLRDFGLLPDLFYTMAAMAGMARAAALDQLGHAGARHTGAVLCGLAVLRGRVQSPAQPFRQHGRADRHGLLGGLFLFPAGDVRLAGRACLL